MRRLLAQLFNREQRLRFSQKVTIESKPSALFDSPAIKFQSLYEALSALEIASAAPFVQNHDEKALVVAFEELCNGQDHNALEKFEKLSHEAKSDEVIVLARDFYRHLLIGLNWQMSVSTTHDGETLQVNPFNDPVKCWHFPKDPVYAPLLEAPFDLPVISVLLGGQKRRFLVDTGASRCVLPSSIADELALERFELVGHTVATSTTKMIPSLYTTIPELELGEIHMSNISAGVVAQNDFDTAFPPGSIPVDGVLGWTALRNLSVILDYQEKIATFKEPGTYCTSERNLFFLGFPIVKAKALDGNPLVFGLDTGGYKTFVYPRISDLATIVRYKNAQIEGRGVGGAELLEIEGRLPEIRIAFPSSVVCLENLFSYSSKRTPLCRMHGMLGIDIASQPGAKIAFDYKSGYFNVQA